MVNHEEIMQESITGTRSCVRDTYSKEEAWYLERNVLATTVDGHSRDIEHQYDKDATLDVESQRRKDLENEQERLWIQQGQTDRSTERKKVQQRPTLQGAIEQHLDTDPETSNSRDIVFR